MNDNRAGLLEADMLEADVRGLTHDERLDALAAVERAKATLDARAQVLLHALAREGDAEQRSREWVREEVAAVLRLAPVTASRRLHDATRLVDLLPATLAMLAAGTTTLLHARTLSDAVADLDPAAVAAVEERVLPRAATQTAGEFRRTVQRAALAADPKGADGRHADALEKRRVELYPEDHGMASVVAYLRADDAERLYTAADAAAAAARAADPHDERTADQRRVDALADLATAALHATPVRWQGRKPAVRVSVALSTLLGLDNQPGELADYGPICPALARAIAADPSGTWTRLITDPAGRLLDYGQTTYRAPAPLREHIMAESETCTFPGCRRNTRRSDLDHLVPWAAGGRTSPENLHPPCERHHMLRHEGSWRVRRDNTGSDDHLPGTMIWTTPTGRAFTRPPHTYPVDHTLAMDPPAAADPDPPPF
ncbi:DUF222 domain-containing protein [uncultured Jatrophihabitans sp.]|uniref:HNH endonuclease signature motif containing protein n=1 Tax=uncultured Jatrophihabitans sp. TaxID=1610747 RepID=UPI0035CA3053